MAAKVIQVSDDSGSTWYTLPGASGDLSFNNSTDENTIFGQTFSSTQPHIEDWEISANAYYHGFAGYTVDIKKSGTSTAATGEAMSLVSGKTYEIDDTTKQVWDYNNSVTVYDGASPVAEADIDNVDHLFGRVTFDASYTVTGAVTVDVNYLPMTAVGGANEFTLTQNCDAVDTTTFETAQANGGYRTHSQGLRTVSLDLSGIYASSNGFKTLVDNKNEVVIEINPDGSSYSVARGFFKAASTGQSGDVGANEDETITFELSVPESSTTTTENVVVPFKWLHDTVNTTLSTAVQKVITAWQDETDIDVRYLHDGTNGYSGTAVVTDISLSGGIESTPAYDVSFMGDGATTAVP